MRTGYRLAPRLLRCRRGRVRQCHRWPFHRGNHYAPGNGRMVEPGYYALAHEWWTNFPKGWPHGR